MKKNFRQARVVGQGMPIFFMAEHLKKAGIPVEVMEYSPLDETKHTLPELFKKEGINHEILKGNQIHDKLRAINNECFVLSVWNYLFLKPDVTKKENLTIVNCHEGLLPEYGGLNGPSWAIYNQEKHSGLTWHYVNEGLDTGTILHKVKIPITEHMTSRELDYKGWDAMNDTFDLVFKKVLNSEKGESQTSRPNIYTKHDIPNGGMLDVNAPIDKTYAFLRAMATYNNELGIPKVDINGKRYTWSDFHMWETPVFEKKSVQVIHDTMFIMEKKNTLAITGLQPEKEKH